MKTVQNRNKKNYKKKLDVSSNNKDKLKLKHKHKEERWKRGSFTYSTRKWQEELRASKRWNDIWSNNNSGNRRSSKGKKLRKPPHFWMLNPVTPSQRHQSSKESPNAAPGNQATSPSPQWKPQVWLPTKRSN